MSVSLIESNQNGFSLKLSFTYNKSMFQGEVGILEVINEAGPLATEKIIRAIRYRWLTDQKG